MDLTPARVSHAPAVWLRPLASYLDSRLHRRELQVFSVTVLAFSLAALIVSWATSTRGRTVFGPALGGDFVAFYTVGHILATSPPELIYDPANHTRVMHELFPGLPPGTALPYAHAPFEALLFRPLAYLPYEYAYLAWLVFSLALFAGGFALVWAAAESVPRDLKWTALLLVLAFEPLVMESLLGGQVTGVLFFDVCLVIHLMWRQRWLAAGLVLPLAMYKPTLALLAFAALMIGRRPRMLVGFAIGAIALAGVSVLAVGWQGCVRYVEMVMTFGRDAASPTSALRIWKYVDLNSFLRLLLGDNRSLRIALLLTAAAAVAPLLLRAWRSTPRDDAAGRSLVWATTLTWLLVLNVYGPIYEAVLIAVSLLLTADALYARGPCDRASLTPAFKVLACLAYLVPWVSPFIARGVALQPYTIVLLALGAYQLLLLSAARTLRRESAKRRLATGSGFFA